jgi:hypothetical protein
MDYFWDKLKDAIPNREDLVKNIPGAETAQKIVNAAPRALNTIADVFDPLHLGH